MRGLPPHARLIRDLSFAFHTVSDVAMVVIGFLIVAFVIQPGRRHHLRWAYPTALGLVLTACYRILIDYHYWFSGGPLTHPLFASWFLYVSDLIGIYGAVILWRVLHELSPIWIRPHRGARRRPRLLGRRRRGGRHPRPRPGLVS